MRQVQAFSRAIHRFIKLGQIRSRISGRLGQIDTVAAKLFALDECIRRAFGRPGRELAFDKAQNEYRAKATGAKAVDFLRDDGNWRRVRTREAARGDCSIQFSKEN